MDISTNVKWTNVTNCPAICPEDLEKDHLTERPTNPPTCKTKIKTNISNL